MTENNSLKGLASVTAGQDFQNQLRTAWSKVPGAWRLRIGDEAMGERPADELVLLDTYRFLCEAKTTIQDYFSLNLVKINQLVGLRDFEKCNKLNVGILIINFSILDTCYIVRAARLLQYMKQINKSTVAERDFDNEMFPCLQIYKDKGIWNLKTVEKHLGDFL